MSTKIVRDILGLDTSSPRTAADVRALVPGRWPTDADVPLYLYKSLREIVAPSVAPVDFPLIIIETYGAGMTPHDVGIHLITLPSESVSKDYGMQSDKVGVETAFLKVLVQLGENLSPAEADLAEQADLRVRWLLDYNIRSLRRKYGDTITPGLSSSADSSLYLNSKDTPIICLFQTYLDNETSVAKASLFTLQYSRIFV